MHFYSKNHFKCIFIEKTFSMHFYSKNHFLCIFIEKTFSMHFIVKIISNAFL